MWASSSRTGITSPCAAAGPTGSATASWREEIYLTRKFGFPFQVNIGAFTGRYGAMGTYDADRYGTPLIARTNTIGETITVGHMVGDVMLMLEQGLGGQMARPPVGLVSAGWNDFASANVGATFVNHVHLGAAYQPWGKIGLHYLTAWTQDDLTAAGTVVWAQEQDSGGGTPLYANEVGRGGRMLDGGAVDAGSVRLAGRRVSWLSGGQPRAATVR